MEYIVKDGMMKRFGILLSTYLVKVDEVKNTKHHIENASMATFDFSGTVEVAVTYNKRKVNTARIRPLSHNISSVSYTHLTLPTSDLV